MLNVKEATIEPINDIVEVPSSKLISKINDVLRLPVNKKFIKKPIRTRGIIVNNQYESTLANTLISRISELITIPSKVPSS